MKATIVEVGFAMGCVTAAPAVAGTLKCPPPDSDEGRQRLPKWWCQKRGARSGQSAIDNKMPANGSALQAGRRVPSSAPSRAREQPSEARAGPTVCACATASPS
jgi:hypothetical protein